MNHDQHISSRLLALAGGLMLVSGLLMAVCGKLAYGGTFWAAASCMFFAANHFRIAENKKTEEEKNDDGKETV